MNLLVPGSTSWCLRYDAEHENKFAAKHLWTYLLNKYIFPGEEWVVSTGKPPARHDNLHRTDILVEHCQDSELHTFLVCQKNCGPIDPKMIGEMERKASKRSVAYLSASGREAVWAMTCWGPFFRIWVCRKHGPPHLEPFYPQGRRDPSLGAYLDIKHAAQEFQECFDLMKRYKKPHATILADLRNANKVSNAVYLSPLDAAMFQGQSRSFVPEADHTGRASRVDLSDLSSPVLNGQGSHSSRAGVLEYLAEVEQIGESSGQAGEEKWHIYSDENTTAGPATFDSQGDAIRLWVQVTRVCSKRKIGEERWNVSLPDGVTMMTRRHRWTKVCDGSDTYWAWGYGRIWYYTRFAD